MTKIKGKFKYLFASGFFIVGIIGGIFWLTYNNYFYNTEVTDKVSSNLIKITEEKTLKINNYLEAMEKDVKILQESDEVKRLLKQDLIFGESLIKLDVDERTRVISKEVENYLRAHPEMTLKELQESKNFQDIAVQPVGKEGYSFVFDSQSLINYFHKEPRRIGYDYNTMEKTFPELWKMFKETSEKGFSEGFYYRDEPDGSTSYKYGKFVQIPVKTADGINMSVGTTAYVSDYVIKMDVDERARIITKEVENYIKVHPEMTLKDLQESREFQKIAIQPVGKEGYSFLFDSQSLINHFHKEPRRIGYDYNTMEETFPELWNMFKETSRKGFSEGFYYRDEPDGSTSYKYGKFVQIPVKTADGINMSVGTTAYVSDYKIIKEESEYLENFKEDLDYHNLVLVSPEGYIIYMAEVMGDFGTNLEWEVNLKKGLSKNYFDVKESEKISFSDLFIRHYEDVYPRISVMAPVYEGDNLLGYIGLIDDADKIFKITEDTENLGETGESYLINDEKLLISPSRNSDFDILIQSIDTENAQHCFDEAPGHSREVIVTSFFDYRGEVVLGAHRRINGTKWCLLIEIDKEEAINAPLKSNLKKRILTYFIFVVILTLIGFFVGKYFEKKNIESKIKNFPCGIKRKFQPWYCKLIGGKCATYPKGRCGTVIKIRKFIINLKLRYIILFAAAFCLGYFFLVTSFFQGWRNAAFYDEISDLLAVFVLILLLFYGLKLKNNPAKLLVSFGSLLAILDKLVQIILEEYIFAFGVISAFYWIPGAIVGFIGFILIFFGFKKTL